jgi:hypothetical protein
MDDRPLVTWSASRQADCSRREHEPSGEPMQLRWLAALLHPRILVLALLLGVVVCILVTAGGI